MKHHLDSFRMKTIIAVVCILFVPQAFSAAQDNATKIDELMQVYHDYGMFNGTVLVAEGGKVIYKKGFGMANMEWNVPNKSDTKFRLGSITKQFTSMLIMQLVEEGKIELEGKLTDYLPDYRKDTGDKVTIHHLLTHTSGIPSYTNIPNFFQDISRDPYSIDETIEKFCSGDLEFEPGTRYRYNNSGYFLLGAVIEKVTGKAYEDVLEERILDPLRMTNTGYDHHERIIPDRAAGYRQTFDGYENAPYLDMMLPFSAGALYSSVEDLYLWDQALYTEKLISNKMKALLFKSHTPAGVGAHYGYGWTIHKRKLPESKKTVNIISHGGGINGFNTLIERLVDDKHLIVLLNNTPGASLSGMSRSIMNILYNKPYQLPKKSVAEEIYKVLNEKDINAAVNKYEELKKEHPKDYNFQPIDLNRLGYHLLERKKRIQDAIEIFKLNVRIYPKYANGYDSLAEAYMVNGDTKLAIKNYAKSLELNPNNTNALDRLNELMKMENK